MKYRVITDTDLNAFQQRVTACLREGWDLAGQLVVIVDETEPTGYYQALTILEPDVLKDVASIRITD